MAEKPTDSPEKPAPEPGKSEPVKPIAVTPRQSSGSADRVTPQSAVPVTPAAINEQLMSALAQVLTAQGAAAAAPVRDERGLMSREEKRFRRGGPGARSDATPEKSDSAIADAPKISPIVEPEKRPTTAPLEIPPPQEAKKLDPVEPVEPAERRLRQERDDPSVLRPTAPKFGPIWRRIPPGQRSAILGVLGVIVALIGFALGRTTSPTPLPGIAQNGPQTIPTVVEGQATHVTPRMAEPAEIALIDEAMIAQTNGDFAQADKLLRQLLASAPDLNGTQTALVLLNLQKGDAAEAQMHIWRGMDAGEDAGRLYGLRGAILAQLGRPRLALESFEMATRATPHQFKPFFLLAEMLRRGGKNQQALDRFDQALARVHEQADEDAMLFKRRLTLIASGRGDELAAEIKQQLAQEPPAGDWLLLAMALDAQKGDFKAAAVPLDRASKLMNTDWMVDRLRDFFLYQWAYEKELEPYFRPLQKRLAALRQKEPPPQDGKDAGERALPGASPSATSPP